MSEHVHQNVCADTLSGCKGPDPEWVRSAALFCREIRSIKIPAPGRATGTREGSHEATAVHHSAVGAVTSRDNASLENIPYPQK